MVKQDYTALEIGRKLHLKERTVWNKKNILRKKIMQELEDFSNEDRYDK